MAAAATYGARPKHPWRRWLSFALRALLIAALAALFAFGWRSNNARHQRSIVDQMAALDAHVIYDYGHAGADHPSSPTWLRHLVGDDFLADVVGIEASIPAANDEALAAITALPHLKFLVLREGLDDAAMILLPSAYELERLTFSSPKVTDAGLSQLTNLKQLTHLSIGAPHVTDTGLMLLESLPNLLHVDLIATEVTAKGVDRLRTALPHCDVRVYREAPQRL